MSRALVLGGGGPVGIGWETGLVLGLADAGVDLAGADAVIGTSAGSVVGAHLALGLDLVEGVHTATRRRRAADDESVAEPTGAGRGSVETGMRALMDAMAELTRIGASAQERRRALGRLALDTATRPEAWFVGFFADLADRGWPEGFRCTAVDAESGDLVVWSASSGVPLDRAVASSCAVPAVYPPVTIDGRRYVDGGVGSSLNADLAVGHDVVLVVSVTMLEAPPGVADPRLQRVLAQTGSELDELRRSGSVVACIGPGEEFLAVSGMGLHLMDPGRVDAALDAGIRQGRDEGDRIGARWSPA